MTAGGLKVAVEDGKLKIVQEGATKKLVPSVQQITFSSKFAVETEQNVLYITERAVFKLTKEVMMLIEIAPGMDLQKDIIDQMGFTPIIAEDLKEMDSRIFREELMGLTL
jgi:propionate CoA-transferase